MLVGLRKRDIAVVAAPNVTKTHCGKNATYASLSSTLPRGAGSLVALTRMYSCCARPMSLMYLRRENFDTALQ